MFKKLFSYFFFSIIFSQLAWGIHIDFEDGPRSYARVIFTAHAVETSSEGPFADDKGFNFFEGQFEKGARCKLDISASSIGPLKNYLETPSSPKAMLLFTATVEWYTDFPSPKSKPTSFIAFTPFAQANTFKTLQCILEDLSLALNTAPLGTQVKVSPAVADIMQKESGFVCEEDLSSPIF